MLIFLFLPPYPSMCPLLIFYDLFQSNTIHLLCFLSSENKLFLWVGLLSIQIHSRGIRKGWCNKQQKKPKPKQTNFQQSKIKQTRKSPALLYVCNFPTMLQNSPVMINVLCFPQTLQMRCFVPSCTDSSVRVVPCFLRLPGEKMQTLRC